MRDEVVPRGRGVQSAEVATVVLAALARAGRPMGLTEIAAAVEMAPAKVHRYLVSLTETGMVAHRHAKSYDLGPLAAEIGVAAIARQDPVNRVADALPELVDATGLTAMLSIWGSQGPTVVRWERANEPLVTMLGLGSVLSPWRSATGRAFLAHYPDRIAIPAAEAAGGDAAQLDEVRETVRRDGLATADSDFIPGLAALAAPILDIVGQPAAVVTLISRGQSLLETGSLARQTLTIFARTPR